MAINVARYSSYLPMAKQCVTYVRIQTFLDHNKVVFKQIAFVHRQHLQTFCHPQCFGWANAARYWEISWSRAETLLPYCSLESVRNYWLFYDRDLHQKLSETVNMYLKPSDMIAYTLIFASFPGALVGTSR